MTLEQWSRNEQLKTDLQTILKSDAFKEAKGLVKDNYEHKNSIIDPQIWDEKLMAVRQHVLSRREGVLLAFDFLEALAAVEPDKKAPSKNYEEPFEYLTPEEQEKINTAKQEEKK